MRFKGYDTPTRLMECMFLAGIDRLRFEFYLYLSVSCPELLEEPLKDDL